MLSCLHALKANFLTTVNHAEAKYNSQRDDAGQLL